MEDVFKKEVSICRKEGERNGGKCNWGKCRDCGVLPLLYKLYRDEFIDSPEEVEKVKRENGLI
jgi:hypothetical protein